ncbi:hypothetical protein MKW92_045518, partial [Papaver armeniacum]
DRKRDDIVEALRLIYSDDNDVAKEISALNLRLEDENKTLNEKGKHVVRKQLAYGISLQ